MVDPDTADNASNSLSGTGGSERLGLGVQLCPGTLSHWQLEEGDPDLLTTSYPLALFLTISLFHYYTGAQGSSVPALWHIDLGMELVNDLLSSPEIEITGKLDF